MTAKTIEIVAFVSRKAPARVTLEDIYYGTSLKSRGYLSKLLRELCDPQDGRLVRALDEVDGRFQYSYSLGDGKKAVLKPGIRSVTRHVCADTPGAAPAGTSPRLSVFQACGYWHLVRGNLMFRLTPDEAASFARGVLR